MSKIYKNNVIIDSDIVSKKYNNSLDDFFEYLENRNFVNFPKVISVENNIIRTEYIESKDYYEITHGVELMKTMSSLHYKTLIFKDVSKNKYRNIYDKLSSNIEYLKMYYINMIEDIEMEEYMSPSNYLIARNYSAIDSSLNYCSKELKRWFKMVENKSKERVCTLHNNICTDHFIRGDKNYFVSWDNHMVDTPILDIYKFYKKEGYKLDFNYLLKIYNENLELFPEEKLMLNILISMPPKIEKINDEYKNTIIIRDIFNYIYSGMNIINENK